jgi:preprotein translocase subunit YajC
MEFLPLVVLAVLFWVLIIRPQRNRAKRQGTLIEGLERGQEVVTAGGLYGRIDHVGDDDLLLEIAPDTVVRVDKRAVTQLAPESAETGPSQLT